MAEIKAWPLNLTSYSYNAEDVMRWMAGKTSGIYGQDGNYQVIADSGMNITVKAAGMIGGWLSNMGKYGICFWNDTDIDLTVETADGNLPRKDRVIVSWHIPQQTTLPTVAIRKGNPASNPQGPALVNNGEYAEICLAEISVPAGTTEITADLINDTRLNESLCGLVSSGIETIPTDGLEQEFQYWFDNVKETLSGDVAGNLQTQITEHVTNNTIHTSLDERNLFKSRVIDATCTYSGNVFTLTLQNAPATLPNVFSVRFKSPASYTEGDTFNINGESYTTTQVNSIDPVSDNAFLSGKIVTLDIDNTTKTVNFKTRGGGSGPTLIDYTRNPDPSSYVGWSSNSVTEKGRYLLIGYQESDYTHGFEICTLIRGVLTSIIFRGDSSVEHMISFNSGTVFFTKAASGTVDWYGYYIFEC